MRCSHSLLARSWLVRRMRRRASAPSLVQEAVCLSYSEASAAGTRPLSAQSLYQDCRRLYGPPLPPNGTPTPKPSLERLNERIEHLAYGPRREGGAPVETYTAAPTAHGDVVSATSSYREWFLRTYPAARSEDCNGPSASDPPNKGVGGTPRWSQNGLTRPLD